MRALTVFLPGRFEDVQFYMGHILAWTNERTLQVFSVDDVASAVEAHDERSAGLADLLFARNDWLSSKGVESLLRTKGVPEAIDRVLNRFPQPLELAISPVAEIDTDGELEGTVLLSTHVYNRRVYVGTDKGLFSSDPDWEGTFESGTFARRLDSRCVFISARYGAVSASCESDGLFTFFDEFGWRTWENPQVRQVAPLSIRTGWWREGLRQSLLNYVTATMPELLRAETEKVEDTRSYEGERSVLVDFEADQELDSLVNGFANRASVASDEIQFVWNSTNLFFANSSSAGLFAFSAKRRAPNATPGLDADWIKEYPGFSGRILAAAATPRGVVFEGDFSVVLFSNSEFSTLYEGEAIAVRTFMNSRRYRHLVAIVRDDGLQVTGLV